MEDEPRVTGENEFTDLRFAEEIAALLRLPLQLVSATVAHPVSSHVIYSNSKLKLSRLPPAAT